MPYLRLKLALLFLFWSAFFLGAIPSSALGAEAEKILSPEQLAETIRPAIVRIVRTATGKVFIDPFEPNFTLGTITKIPGKTYEAPIKETSAGSGFIVTPQGHILTNAHVVSEEMLKYEFAYSLAKDLQFYSLLGFIGTKAKPTDKKPTQEEEEAFFEKLVDYILANSRFDIVNDIKVLDPKATSTKPLEIIAASIPAKIVAEHEHIEKNNHDVALIKIDEQNAPAITLAASSSVRIGQPVYVFGFPGSADIGEGGLLQSTFTTGILSSIKDLDFKKKKITVYQTDAKVAAGSSGGPMLDSNGSVIGMVTFYVSGSRGDGFSSILPISIAKELLIKTGIEPKIGTFTSHFTEGLHLLEKRRCLEAKKEFGLATENTSRFVNPQAGAPYITTCDILQANNQSIDTKWDAIRIWSGSQDMSVYILFTLGATAVALLLLLLILMRRRLKKDEEELHTLENQMGKATPKPIAPPTNIPPSQGFQGS